jgi:hypothetical protein
MNALVQRIERIVGTVRDPISYRLLWYGLTNRLVSIPGGNFDSSAPANSGWPMDAPSRNSDRIPRIIFQPWTSRHALPANYAYWRQSFVANNTGYKFFFWDDSDNRRFIAEWFPWFLSGFDSYPREIFRTNITRLFFLYARSCVPDTGPGGPLIRKLLLGRIEQGAVHDRWLLAGQDVALISDLADIEPVAEEVEQRSPFERDATASGAGCKKKELDMSRSAKAPRRRGQKLCIIDRGLHLGLVGRHQLS